ncbi:MAG: hypothetical protein GY839_19285 [candidate division Zixibacteria bacterium]|nr:hypothetical protein [candidate division Zixibacteria bacterium]
MEETKQCTYHNPFLSFPPDSMAEYVYDSIGDTILVLIDGEKIITTIESIGWLGAALDSGIKLLLDPINETSPPKYSTFIALSDSLIHYPGIVEKFELIDDPDFEIISMAESLQVIHKEAFVRFDSLRFDKKKSERDEIGNEKTIEYRLNILNSRGYPFFGSVKTRYFTKINPKDTILCYIFAYPSENKCWRSAYNLIRTDTIWKVRTLLEPGAGSFAMTFKCVIDLNNDNIVEYIIAGPGSIGIYRFNGSKFIPLWKSPYFGT